MGMAESSNNTHTERITFNDILDLTMVWLYTDVVSVTFHIGYCILWKILSKEIIPNIVIYAALLGL